MNFLSCVAKNAIKIGYIHSPFLIGLHESSSRKTQEMQLGAREHDTDQIFTKSLVLAQIFTL